MSGVDPLLALDRAARAGVLAAGTGYTWAGQRRPLGAALDPDLWGFDAVRRTT